MTISTTFPDEACTVTCTWKACTCWSGNSKTKHEWKACAMTLLPL